MTPITLGELERGCAAFWRSESRDAMYSVATRLLKLDWGNHRDVSNALGVVLLTWNQAAYRYGSFDFDDLERFLTNNHDALDAFRKRHIATYDALRDGQVVRALFIEALEALAYVNKTRRSPVAVAKALHLLSPDFFPLWDVEIAKGCKCRWSGANAAPEVYLRFMTFAQSTIRSLEDQFKSSRGNGTSTTSDFATDLSRRAGHSKTAIKLLDEYLYARFTQNWV